MQIGKILKMFEISEPQKINHKTFQTFFAIKLYKTNNQTKI